MHAATPKSRPHAVRMGVTLSVVAFLAERRISRAGLSHRKGAREISFAVTFAMSG